MTIRRFCSTALAIALLAGAARAQSVVTPNGSLSFTPGDLLVLQTGNGTSTLGSGAAPIFLDDYNPNGTLTQSVALPTSGSSNSSANLITLGGTAGSEGLLSLSPDGQYVALGGYSEVVGGSTPSGTASTSVSRVGATLSYNGTLTIESMGTTAYNANNVRGAFTTNGTNIWTVGANTTTGEVWYTNGSSTVQITSGPTGGNASINAANGQLYASNKNSVLSIGSGMPTSAVAANGTALFANLTGSGQGNITQFFFANLGGSTTPNTLYMADNVSNTTAILKYSLVSGNWVATGNLSIGSLGNSSVGTTGLTGVLDGNGSETIYGTTPGALFSFVDSSGYDGSINGSPASLATVGANEQFHGITFAPTQITAVPEPAETAALVGAGALGVAMWRRRRTTAPALTPSSVSIRT